MSDRTQGPRNEIPQTVPGAEITGVDYERIQSTGVLGTGGSATVYEAEVGDQPVALKEPQSRDDWSVTERFANEARTWEELSDHDHVVDVLGWGTDPSPWIALEYMDGGSVRDAGRFSLPEAVWIGQCLADAVHYAHRHGVVHLDLKPDNVLFRAVEDAWDVPKVADWGLARRLIDDAEFSSGNAPQYAAPEQLDPGEFGRPDDRTDIYQLGALCYRLLTGQSPHSGGRSGVDRSVFSEETPAPTEVDPAIPESVDRIVERAMATEKTDRYESVLDVRRDLKTVLGDLIDYERETQGRELASDPVPPGVRTDTGPGSSADVETGSGATTSGTAVELERQEFLELTPAYFDRRDPAPPAEAWRAGFRLVDVRHGAAVDRRIERDGERVSPVTEVLSKLRGGSNVAIVGPPGAGKSTICKQVACQWYENDWGSVLYRASGSGKRFESPATLRRHLEERPGHALVVVEEAVRPEANAVFEVVDALGGDEGVSFLVDARRSEWEDLTTGRDALGESSPARVVDVVDVPRPDRQEYERFVEAFRGVADTEVDVSVETLLPDVRSETGTDSRSPGELYLLMHRLLSRLDPLNEESESSSLVTAVRRTWSALSERGEVALDVGIATNLLNAAGVGVYPELIHAVAPEDDSAVAEAIAAMEGGVLFTDGRVPNEEPYRTVHEVWSTEFLTHLVEAEGERRAHERFGGVLSRILALADDPEVRDRVEWILHGEAPYLDRVAADPTSWADAVVSDVFALGVEWPKLAPLFGKTGYSRIDLREACSTAVRVQCSVWRGDMFRASGAYERAIEEYERLADRAETGRTGKLDPDELLARARFGIAKVHVDRGEYGTAVDAAQRGLSVAPDRSRERCRLLGIVADVRLEQGDYDEARHSSIRQRHLAESLDSVDLEAEALHRLGEVSRRRGEYDRATLHFEKSLELSRDIGDREREATALTDLGIVAREQDEYDLARDYYERSLAISRDHGDMQGQAATLQELGIVSEDVGDYEQAREYYERSLEIKRDLGDRQGEANTLNNIGILVWKEGRYDEARENFERSIEIKHQLGDRQGEADTLNNLGVVSEDLGEYEEARQFHERSLEIKRDLGDRQGVASSLNNIGSTLIARADYEAARDRFERSLEITRDIGDRRGEANTYNNLGRIERLTGRYAEANDYIRRSLDIARDIGDRRGEANSLTNLGRVLGLQGEYDAATARHERSLEIARDIGDRWDEAVALANLGDVARQRNNYDLARERFVSARKTFQDLGFRRGLGRVRLNLGRIALEQGHVGPARVQARKVLDSFEEMGLDHWVGRSRLLLGRIAAEGGSPDAARRHFETALARFETVGAPQDVLTTLKRLVATYQDCGEHEKARQSRARARELLAEVPGSVGSRHRQWIDGSAIDGE